MSHVNDFLKFLKESPSDYHAIQRVEELLKCKNNFADKKPKIEKGICSYLTKESEDGKALIAFDIGENFDCENPYLNIIVSHADSPWLKIKDGDFKAKENLNLVPVEKYGSVVSFSWLDRPLKIAGKVFLKGCGKNAEMLVNLENETFVIPTMSVHFEKFLRQPIYKDLNFPIIGDMNGSKNIREYLAKKLKIKVSNIGKFSLNFVSKQEPILWGENKDFISAERLDDLASVFTSTTAFVNSHTKKGINILYIADNEEIGSNTEVGAMNSFLNDTLEMLAKKLKFNLDDALKNSFMLSADNAQAAHPHYPYIYNPNHKVHMNCGVSIKVSNRYCSTQQTAKIFRNICQKAGTPCQTFYNRKDIMGGGTIGKIIQMHTNIKGVDVGIPQLSMHSTFETIGSKDVDYAVNTFKYFYSKFKL